MRLLGLMIGGLVLGRGVVDRGAACPRSDQADQNHLRHEGRLVRAAFVVNTFLHETVLDVEHDKTGRLLVVDFADRVRLRSPTRFPCRLLAIRNQVHRFRRRVDDSRHVRGVHPRDVVGNLVIILMEVEAR